MPAKHSSRSIEIQRVYGAEAKRAAYRVLVDRFWPRGVRKADLEPDAWVKDLAPSAELIKWFGHKAERWDDFRARYMDELSSDAARAAMRDLLAEAGKRDVILLYGARDDEHNQAVVLREALLRLDKHQVA